MSVAVSIQFSDPADLESCLGRSLRIQFYKLYSLIRYCSEERNIMLLCHRMVYRNIVLILCDLPADRMLRVRAFGSERRKCYPAAAYNGFSGRLYNIPADRADIELHTDHVR